MIHPFMRVWCVALGLFVAVAAQAQFRVEVAGVGVTQLPIGFTTFRGAESSPQNIASIVAADLDRSGQFRSNMLSAVVDEVARPDLAAIKQANSTEGPKIREALENLQTKVEGVVTTYDKPFTHDDHEAITANIPVFGEVKGSKVVYAYEEDRKKGSDIRTKVAKQPAKK